MRGLAGLGVLALLLCAAAPSRASGELTGTYAGTFSCALVGGKASALSMLAISERGRSPDGARLFVEIDGVGFAGRAGDGDAEFTNCGAINAGYGDRVHPPERITYATDPASGALVFHLVQRSELGPCEASWTRIDARDPGITACGQ